MSRDNHAGDGDHANGTTGIAPACDGFEESWLLPPETGMPPRLKVRGIVPTALVRFVDAEILFEGAAVRAIGQQLHELVREDGHTRLVVNFAGVRYVSSEVLGVLAGLQGEVERAGGGITLCELDPLLRDMLRIAHLDRVFDVCADEAEALGLIAR